jgi:nucleotide-binding universal stress UspA family protein
MGRARASDRATAAQPPSNILLAEDASAISLAAARVAGGLAARSNALVSVVTVLSPTRRFSHGAATGRQFEIPPSIRYEIGRMYEASRFHSARWRYRLALGAPATEILRESAAGPCGLIVIGLPRRLSTGRSSREETALQVMRRSRIPVLAAASDAKDMTRRIAVAVDFSDGSIAAARLALSLLGEGGALHLVYVEAETRVRTHESEAYRATVAESMATAFTRLIKEFASPRGIETHWSICTGELADELLAFAERRHIDLIALGAPRLTGSRVHGMNSALAALARAGTHSLLVVPSKEHGTTAEIPAQPELDAIASSSGSEK